MGTKEKWNSNLFKHTNIYFYLTYIIVVVVIFGYGSYHCSFTKKDGLQYKLFNHKLLSNIDGWCCTHFVLFSIMGYVFPHSIRLSFLFSVIWELFEYYNEKYKPDITQNATNCNTIWWYARWEDIVINSIGLFIGRTLRLGFFL
jgi:hypothetical protein